jgi:hypothetical protein
LVLAASFRMKLDMATTDADKEFCKSKMLEHFGAAFHTIMDSTSPAHVDKYGFPMKFEKEDFVNHSPNELVGIETAQDITDKINVLTLAMMLEALKASQNGIPFTFPTPSPKPPLDGIQ